MLRWFRLPLQPPELLLLPPPFVLQMRFGLQGVPAGEWLAEVVVVVVVVVLVWVLFGVVVQLLLLLLLIELVVVVVVVDLFFNCSTFGVFAVVVVSPYCKP